MCGIIGYIGKEEAQPILLNGLKRLEYRGYDSAGMVTYLPHTNTLSVRKLPGKVKGLEEQKVKVTQRLSELKQSIIENADFKCKICFNIIISLHTV